MDIRKLMRLARDRWPLPPGKEHRITLNDPDIYPALNEEDCLILSIQADDGPWHFYVMDEVSPEQYMEEIEGLINGARKVT